VEAYILDDQYRRVSVIDKFESFIWTERFSSYGDFELHLHSTRQNKNLLPIGTRLATTESYRVMTVETIIDEIDDEGRALLTVKGRSLESVLLNRLARPELVDLTTLPKWELTDVPAELARTIYHEICGLGALNDGDILPVTEASIFDPDTIPEPTDEITYEIDVISVYEAIKNLADAYSMGFRLVRHPSTGVLYFDVYMGSDRTTQQTTLPAVVFSPGLDNLKNISELSTDVLYKNVAYVISPVGSEIVYALDVDPDISGFDRRILIVKADDLTDSDQINRRGTEELAKSRRLSAFDGELSQSSRYKYGTSYNLGDHVELQNGSGAVSTMQVTEQIFVSDKEGERSYPTLSLVSFAVEGSWNEWPPSEAWDDVDPGLAWDDA
jgi:hypothetical protein